MRLTVLLLVAALSACSGDDGPLPPAEAADLNLVKISGDGQTGEVRASDSGASGSLSGVSFAIADNPDLLPEPLIAKIVVDAGGSLSLMPTGPSFSLSAGGPSMTTVPLPEGTVVTFRVQGEACGTSFISADIPDDSALVSTFWERGTLAGVACEMEARIVVDDVPQVAEVFTATFEPGPVAWIQFVGSGGDVTSGDTIDIRDYLDQAWDVYGNSISLDVVRALPGSVVRSGWYDRVQGGISHPANKSEAPLIGWRVVVPDTANFRLSYDDTYAPGLMVYIDGIVNQYVEDEAGPIFFKIRP